MSDYKKLEYTSIVEFNPKWSREEIKAFKEKIKENGGYCPCAVIKEKDTKCMCREFREQSEGVCHCGLYLRRIVMKNYKK